jgi:hypothetical protein
VRHNTHEPRQEVIIGTATGIIRAFNNVGRLVWTIPLDAPIVDLQAGFVDSRKREEIVICSSNHSVYVVNGKQKQQSLELDDAWVSSLCVTLPNRRSLAEVIIGSEEKKLYIYGGNLQTPSETLPTEERDSLAVMERDELCNSGLTSLGPRFQPGARPCMQTGTVGARQRLICDVPNEDVNEGKTIIVVTSCHVVPKQTFGEHFDVWSPFRRQREHTAQTKGAAENRAELEDTAFVRRQQIQARLNTRLNSVR